MFFWFETLHVLTDIVSTLNIVGKRKVGVCLRILPIQVNLKELSKDDRKKQLIVPNKKLSHIIQMTDDRPVYIVIDQS